MLTGHSLLIKRDQMLAAGHSMREIVIACGYGRENKVPHFTRFYKELIKIKAYDECLQIRYAERDNYSNMKQKAVVDAVFCGENYISETDEVSNYYNNHQITSYCYNGKILVTIIRGNGPTYAILHLPSMRTKTAKCRINSILRRIFGYSLYQKKGEWYISRPFKDDIPYTDGMRIDYPEI